MRNKSDKTMCIGILSICLYAVLFSPYAYAEKKEIHNAYNFYSSDLISDYCEGAGWDYNDIWSFTWKDESESFLLSRSSQGFQYDFYNDTKDALITELTKKGDIRIQPEEGDYDTSESDFKNIRGNVPNYSSYVNTANKFVETALAECGESEIPKDKVKYTRDLHFTDGQPWSCTFVCWVAAQCDLLDSVFGPARIMSNDLYHDMQSKNYKAYNCTEILQFRKNHTGTEYSPVPGDLVFWKGEGDSEFKRVGIVTETGKDYIVITQGNTASGHVLSIIYKELPKEMIQGKVIHIVYPNSIFNANTVKDVIGFLYAQDFNSSAIYGVLGNMDAESGLISYRCEGDMDRSSSYKTSYDYTLAVDNGFKTKYDFMHSGLNGCGKGYGLVQFSYSVYKESLYDLAKKRKTSIGDVETQMIALMDMWRGEMISYGKAQDRGDTITINFMRSLGIDSDVTTNTYDLLHQVPDTEEGAMIACNIILTYYEKPLNPDLNDRLARSAKYTAAVSGGTIGQ